MQRREPVPNETLEGLPDIRSANEGGKVHNALSLYADFLLRGEPTALEESERKLYREGVRHIFTDTILALLKQVTKEKLA